MILLMIQVALIAGIALVGLVLAGLWFSRPPQASRKQSV